MASWNSPVRGQVIAIQKNMGWDPMEIIGDTNPMPTQGNTPGDNPSGLGVYLQPQDDQSQQSAPTMDDPGIPKHRKTHDPHEAKGM